MAMTTVYLDDRNISYDNAPAYFANIADWAREHCHSFDGYHVQDVSDVSMYYDNVAEYKFNDERDVLLFTLKWK